VIGFTAGVHTLYMDIEYNAPQQAAIYPSHDVYIRTNLTNTNIYEARTGASSDILCKVPIIGDYHTLIRYATHGNFFAHIQNSQIDYIVVKLTDSEGNLMDLDAHDWSCTLEIIKVKKQ
jgi:hypothetical protein